MSSKDSAFQVFGQRSIKSSALFCSSNPGKDAKAEANRDQKKAGWTRVSLSEFLDRKLPRTSASPGTIQGKAKPYLTILGSRDVSKLGDLPDCKRNASIEKKNSVDKAVFEQFKLTYKESGEDCHVATGSNKVGDLGEDERRESRKRRNPFEGGIVDPLKRVVVLGQAPSLEQRRNAQSISRNEKRRPLYNHCKPLNSPTNQSIKTMSSRDGSNSAKLSCTESEMFFLSKPGSLAMTNLFRQIFASLTLLPDANGGGFWDGGMEGFESEEVGTSEVWEGVGSTTIGGIDWH